jgi:hypothetical protein
VPNRIYWSIQIVLFSISLCAQPKTDNYVDETSRLSLFVKAYNNQKFLWSGTSFIIKASGIFYLITNNHIVGGEFAKDEYLKIHQRQLPLDSIPDSLRVKFFTKEFGQFSWETIPLNDSKSKPNWIKFWDKTSSSQTLLDVAAIPIDSQKISSNTEWWYDSDENMNHKLLLYPGMELFIVGYPSDSGRINPLPIWKRGTIASEADLIDLGMSRFWIDGTGRGGMSGSPVFFRGNDYMEKYHQHVVGGLATFLVGIYSAQNYPLELGVVTRLDNVFKQLKEMSH